MLYQSKTIYVESVELKMILIKYPKMNLLGLINLIELKAMMSAWIKMLCLIGISIIIIALLLNINNLHLDLLDIISKFSDDTELRIRIITWQIKKIKHMLGS